MRVLLFLLASAACLAAQTSAFADDDASKSYVIPALEIVGFDTLLNQFNRHHFAGDTYDSNLASIRRNLRGGWTVDNDPYKTNQVLHPYQGSMYHGFARSAGLSYWESAAYTFAGSVFWEIAGETTPPSKNDQVASGIAGSFLGEPLFRISQLVLERGDMLSPLWRETLAAAISPSTGFNRLAFGKRFDAVFDSHDPAYYGSLQLGGHATTRNRLGPSTQTQRSDVIAAFSIDYGLPGRPGYTYKRPFDYFTAQLTASSGGGVESLDTLGLLWGTRYESGDAWSGVWGLYGSYDYIAPRLFRVSSTALSLGTTGLLRLGRALALQATATLGVGYAAAGTLRSAGPTDYHYGLAPQALLALRLFLGDRASLDLTAREFFVSKVAAAERSGRDNVVRAEASFNVRLLGHQAVALKYFVSRRDAALSGFPSLTQQRGTVGVFYTLLFESLP